MAFNKKQKKTIAAMSSVVGLRMLAVFLVLPVFVLFAEKFTSSFILIGIAFGIYGLSRAIFQIPFGYISDKIGRKNVLFFGMLLFGIFTFIIGFSDNIYELILFRFLQGVAAESSVAFALVSDTVSESDRTKAMAFLGIPIGLSFVVGIVMGPLLSYYFGYPFLFYISGIFGIISALLIMVLVEEPKSKEMLKEIEVSFKDAVAVFKNKTLANLSLQGFLLSFFMTVFFFGLPLIVKHELGTGYYYKVLIPMVVFSLFAMMKASKKADMGYEVHLLKLSFLLMAVSSIFMFSDAKGYALPVIIIGGILFFTGFSITEPIMPSLVSSSSDKSFVGTSMGVYNTLQFLGSFIGGSIAGLLYESYRSFIPAILIASSLICYLLIMRIKK
ncbi:MAG: MFS transporter [Candidatus Acidulodesulfobacterium acidiphilum]|uniref:MFS transporter n=1 Tax=Candidatus Acidulodesulfobacterium acidiphilum TaxID=2597224 RepID=A0A520XEM8_9DELT|nr:MAG: MFS transporter [Candidatus Acidulodesulfobacterium acidiphilum]